VALPHNSLGQKRRGKGRRWGRVLFYWEEYMRLYMRKKEVREKDNTTKKRTRKMCHDRLWNYPPSNLSIEETNM